MRNKIIFWTCIWLSVVHIGLSAMDGQPQPQQQPAPVAIPAQQPQAIQEPATRLRQQFNIIFDQFETMTNERMAQTLDACRNALTDLQASITQFQINDDYQTANTARVMHSFFGTLKANIATCQTQIAQLPEAGHDWLEQDERQSQLNVIRQDLAQIQSQLNTLFRILGGLSYRLAPTQEGEHAIAMRLWQQQSTLSLANILGRTALSYCWNRLTGLNNPQSTTQALNTAKQEADTLYTDSLVARRDSTAHLFDLAGRLGGTGLGRYNWAMPLLIAASNRFLPNQPDAEQDQNKQQVNKVMKLLSLFDSSGRLNENGHHESALPIEHPWIIRAAIRYVPTRLVRWAESAIRTANAPLANNQNWLSWCKTRASKYSSKLSCAFLRVALGTSFHSLERAVFRGEPISDTLNTVKQLYQNPLTKRTIDLGIDLAAYHAPEIRAGAAALNGWLANWKTCSAAENNDALQKRAGEILKNRNLMNGDMRARLDEWAQQWRNGQVA